MKWWRRPEPIDAGEELERIEGERGASSIGSQTRPMQAGVKALMTVAGLVVVLFLGWLTLKALSQSKAATDGQAKIIPTVGKVIPGLQVSQPTPDPAPAAQTAPVAFAPPIEPPREPFHYSPTPNGQKEKTPAEDWAERLKKPTLGHITSSSEPQQIASAEASFGGSEANDGLAGKLQPMRLKPSRAGMIRNRDMVVTQGAMIDCVLSTRLVTTQPGMVVCYSTSDVYSTSGRVVLIDKGSKFVGRSDAGITQGQARIFVIWERLETRQGVIIELNSPGAGPIGEGGLGGYVDNHFWQRFGGAIMISLIGDLGSAAANAATGGGSGSNNQVMQFGGTAQGMQQAAAEALRNSINIPPTLYKNQGERVAIAVARDLDFSGVYELEPR